mmetsp:Transcript_13008/g.20452  ORF Transcript_13008/g.20452 Transcript_13008/m.20452 type:complete len:185 (+) Transcript_13008:172-726(+)|eukprot:CAMPEP_0184300782 /NCGR_PEP_ID=MMETSP1049-20130417/11133_1 /TAXON_ID=77928 /ORGANISM="Proteomonas sulcata, Strain CCMP704" /LENGTH=184 /DNA_ID=CAMNT_0026611597 /DNA_START=153 /DNA_END=707 /DNA_ORIENTATION=+
MLRPTVICRWLCTALLVASVEVNAFVNVGHSSFVGVTAVRSLCLRAPATGFGVMGGSDATSIRRRPVSALQLAAVEYVQDPEDLATCSRAEDKIRTALKASEVAVTLVPKKLDPDSSKHLVMNAGGSEAKVYITVVSDEFEGKNKLKRQQAVYAAITDELQGPIHAVANMQTFTPTEWEEKGKN